MGQFQYSAIARSDDVQVWSKQQHLAILAGGFTDVSASGAVSASEQFDALPNPPGANTAVGWVVYQFADGTEPDIFFKVEWGSGALVLWLGTWLTVGTEHDGSGSLSGQTFARRALDRSNTNNLHQWFVGASGAVTNSYVCVTGPAIDIEQQGYTAVNSMFWTIERFKDGNGDDTTGGFLVITTDAGTIHAVGSIPSSGSSPTVEARYPTAPPVTNPATHGGKIPLGTVFPHPSISQTPATIALIGNIEVITFYDTIEVEIYPGKPKTYLNTTLASTHVANMSNTRLLMRYD
jgi:hypothetical protein